MKATTEATKPRQSDPKEERARLIATVASEALHVPDHSALSQQHFDTMMFSLTQELDGDAEEAKRRVVGALRHRGNAWMDLVTSPEGKRWIIRRLGVNRDVEIYEMDQSRKRRRAARTAAA